MADKDKKTLMGKTNEVAPEKELGGNEVFQTEDGQFNKTTIPFCNVCGTKLNDEMVVCQESKHIICPGCSVKMDQRNLCFNCVKAKVPLSKRGYKALLLVSYGFRWYRTIRNIARIPKKEAKKTIDDLLESGFAEKNLFGLKITDYGLETLFVYEKIYSTEKDVIKMRSRAR